MTLGEKQKQFTFMISKLMVWAYENGYGLTFGDARRSDEQAAINSIGFQGREQVAKLIQNEFPGLAAAIKNNGKADGIVHSIHQDQLAVDFNLFKDGKYLDKTIDHKPLGEFWESIGGTWGGRFGDGNHYSIEHEGRK